MKRLALTLTSIFCVLTALLTSVTATQAKTETMAKNPMIYFVMLDRFENGDPSNDSGGIIGGSQKSGFKPTDNGFYHGGDIAGLRARIPYIKSLGFTAIWITPVVRQQPVSPDGGSAAYHGYWGAGFDQVDPHLGTMQEFTDFVSASHEAGLGVILDIVVNHTADVIYSSAGTMYSPADFFPWRTKDGKTFDAAKLAGTTKFPKLSQLSEFSSFPNPPLLNTVDENVKSPAWLNDVRNYHNRGNTTFEGESSQYGDFFGLDDLFTESPVVVQGMTKVFSDWITNTGIDGFRIDTAKHVNPRFWKAFLPAMRAVAAKNGKMYFPMWGEVYDTNALNTSYWVKNARFTEVLDFPLQERLVNYIRTGSTDGLTGLFANDDEYITRASGPNQLVTFLGNHDMGRIGSFIANNGGSAAEQLAKDEMAHALMFTLRGNPAVYYGDEFGLQGGNDKSARQDLFPTQVNQWKQEPRIGSAPIGNASSFDTTNPLQDVIRSLTSLRASSSAFAQGPQVIRYSQSGVFVFSRFDAESNREYVCAFNASTSNANVKIRVGTPNTTWNAIRGTGDLQSDSSIATLNLAAGKWAVFQGGDAVPTATNVGVKLSKVTLDPMNYSQYKLMARVSGTPFATVEFFMRSTKTKWTSLGIDQSPAFSTGLYRTFPQRAFFAKGKKYFLKAVVRGVGGKSVTSPITTVIGR